MELQAIRREVDADNSCLFSSIAYLVDREHFNSESGLKFRQIIVDFLLSNKSYDILLDLPKDQYIEYIIDPRNWGGALEVKMFSEIFQKQICCIDVKTNRSDIYGIEHAYKQCIYLLYNGIHYDPLVMNFDSDSDALYDITIFDSDDNEVFELMKILIANYKDKGDFVDFASLQCELCNQKFTNQNDATEHGIANDHWNFKQI